MKTRLFVVLLVAISLLAALSWAAAAQGPDPRISTQSSYGPPQPDAVPPWDEMKPGVHAQPTPANPSTSTGPANAPAVNLGQPGLSFRYVHTFGVTEQGYLTDGQHLNAPSGLFIDGGNNLYVVEEHGNRLLRFNSAGVNTLAVGTASLCIDSMSGLLISYPLHFNKVS